MQTSKEISKNRARNLIRPRSNCQHVARSTSAFFSERERPSYKIPNWAPFRLEACCFAVRRCTRRRLAPPHSRCPEAGTSLATECWHAG